MRTYGITVADVMQAIRENRSAITFWTRRDSEGNYRVTVSDAKRSEIVTSHKDNVRDLRIVLAMVRFPEFPADAFRFGPDFTPVIVTDAVSEDTVSEDTVSEDDRQAFVDAVSDYVAETIGEAVSA